MIFTITIVQNIEYIHVQIKSTKVQTLGVGVSREHAQILFARDVKLVEQSWLAAILLSDWCL